MKSNVSNWLDQLNNGVIKSKTVRLIDCIKKQKSTDICELRLILDMPHQTLTALLSNIMDQGIVKIIGERTINGVRYSVLCFVDSDIERNQLKKMRELEMFNQWIKQGKNKYYHLMQMEMRKAINKSIDNSRTQQNFIQSQLFHI